MSKYNPYAFYRLAVFNCNHCGEELCFDVRGDYINENEDKVSKSLSNLKSARCPCCHSDIDVNKSKIKIFKEPIGIRIWNKSKLATS